MAQSLRYQVVKQGGPFELVKVDRPAIQAEDEVLVKLKAVALQPLDWKQLLYGIMVSEWPATLGIDAVGVIEAVGKGVKNLKVADEVLAWGVPDSRGKTHQEYIISNQKRLAKKPESMTFEDAAAIPAGYVTSISAIYQSLGIPLPFLYKFGGLRDGFKPKSVMVLGGSSSVGGTAIQLLRLALPDAFIATTSSAKHHDHLVSLGASKAFERSAGASDIRSATPDGKGVDAIIDCVNGLASDQSILDILDPSGPKKIAEVTTGTNLEKIPDGLDHKQSSGGFVYSMAGADEGAWPALEELLASGNLKLPLDVKVVGQGLETIGEGITELKQGVSGTKLVVKL